MGRDTWTRAVRAVSAAVKCRRCNGWGGYWHATKWRSCESCHGTGSA